MLEAASSMGDVVMGWGEGSVLLRLNFAVMVTQSLRGLGLSRLRALWDAWWSLDRWIYTCASGPSVVFSLCIQRVLMPLSRM